MPRFFLIVLALVASLAGTVSDVAAQMNYNLSQARKSVVCIKRVTPGATPGMGTGVFVSADGLIVTNRHVAVPEDPNAKGTKIFVGVPSEKDADELEYFAAELVYAAPLEDRLDFAALKIAAKDEKRVFPALKLATAKAELGSDVAVLGYPYVKDDEPTLSFTKGSLSSGRIKLNGKVYYQTDAAVNPGNSGGPLINIAGEMLGMVTAKLGEADNIGFALHLSELEVAMKASVDAAAKVKPAPGPVASIADELPTSFPTDKDSWVVGTATVEEEKGILTLDNNGGVFWVTSKEKLPENFQLVMRCHVEFLQGRQVLQPSQRSILRSLFVRFGTDKTDENILEGKNGYFMQMSHALTVVRRNGVDVKVEHVGNPDRPFTLTVTRNKGECKIAVNGRVALQFTDKEPLEGSHALSIGGYLSRVYVVDMVVTDLDEEKAEKKE